MSESCLPGIEALGAGVEHDWRGRILETPPHRRQVADIAVHDPEEGGALIGGN